MDIYQGVDEHLNQKNLYTPIEKEKLRYYKRLIDSKELKISRIYKRKIKKIIDAQEQLK